ITRSTAGLKIQPFLYSLSKRKTPHRIGLKRKRGMTLQFTCRLTKLFGRNYGSFPFLLYFFKFFFYSLCLFLPCLNFVTHLLLYTGKVAAELLLKPGTQLPPGLESHFLHIFNMGCLLHSVNSCVLINECFFKTIHAPEILQCFFLRRRRFLSHFLKHLSL